MKEVILILATFTVALVQCRQPRYHRTPVGDSIDIASMKLLKKTYEQHDDKNIVSSPLGVLTLLSLYASGASGTNREEIMQLLGSTDYKQLSDSYSQLSGRFGAMDPRYLSVANKIFISNNYSLQRRFSNTAQSYNCELENIDFGNKKLAVDTINQWSSNKTNGIINHPVSESDIDMDTIAALLNVIFFQGHWHVPFNASDTKDKDFYIDRSTVVKKPMMHLEQSLFYYEDNELGAKMVELPYKESNFRMIVVLPNEEDGLPKVLKKASEKGLLKSIFSMGNPGTEVHLDMPKFEIKTKINFKSILPKVGVSKIFKDGSYGIVKNSGVVVSEALQEAFIKVDEEGAVAGAFTGFVVVFLSYPSETPEPIYFKVDHPFLYVILYEDIVLFAGTYTH